jgi:hypothetical protein
VAVNAIEQQSIETELEGVEIGTVRHHDHLVRHRLLPAISRVDGEPKRKFRISSNRYCRIQPSSSDDRDINAFEVSKVRIFARVELAATSN